MLIINAGFSDISANNTDIRFSLRNISGIKVMLDYFSQPSVLSVNYHSYKNLKVRH